MKTALKVLGVMTALALALLTGAVAFIGYLAEEEEEYGG